MNVGNKEKYSSLISFCFIFLQVSAKFRKLTKVCFLTFSINRWNGNFSKSLTEEKTNPWLFIFQFTMFPLDLACFIRAIEALRQKLDAQIREENLATIGKIIPGPSRQLDWDWEDDDQAIPIQQYLDWIDIETALSLEWEKIKFKILATAQSFQVDIPSKDDLQRYLCEDCHHYNIQVEPIACDCYYRKLCPACSQDSFAHFHPFRFISC